MNQQGTLTVFEAYFQRDFRPQFMEEMWGSAAPRWLCDKVQKQCNLHYQQELSCWCDRYACISSN